MFHAQSVESVVCRSPVNAVPRDVDLRVPQLTPAVLVPVTDSWVQTVDRDVWLVCRRKMRDRRRR